MKSIMTGFRSSFAKARASSISFPHSIRDCSPQPAERAIEASVSRMRSALASLAFLYDFIPPVLFCIISVLSELP
jgi:hypothetical protein